MFKSLYYKLNSGKRAKWPYMVVNYLRLLVPDSWYRVRLKNKLAKISDRSDSEYIWQRVNYYNKLQADCVVPLPDDALQLSSPMQLHKVYWFDTRVVNRWFDQHLRWHFLPGDITHVPEVPGIVKSRPIAGDNANSVVLKLNQIRHFIFVKHDRPFAEKCDRVIFRGKVEGKESRVRFFQTHFNNPLCDLGDTSRHSADPDAWKTPKMTIRQQLDYKFILALEGNDVASNLKWVMSSNSIAVMPRPKYETWFMEGTLRPNYHYIEVKSDFSDLEERIQYYLAHPEEACEIIRHAHEYVAQFMDDEREELIGLQVMQCYFERTGQLS